MFRTSKIANCEVFLMLLSTVENRHIWQKDSMMCYFFGLRIKSKLYFQVNG